MFMVVSIGWVKIWGDWTDYGSGFSGNSGSSWNSRVGKDHLGRVQNFLAAYPVWTLLHGVFANQIHAAAKQMFQLMFNLDMFQQASVGIPLKRHKNVQIAGWPEVLAQNGAKECQLLDLPSLAKFRYLLL
jgi:hypothetical protein